MPLIAVASIAQPLVIAFLSQRTLGVLLLALWIGLAIHAWTRATRIETRHLNIAVSEQQQALRLVQISDIHIGSRSPAFLHQLIDQVVRQKPDIVLITGDFTGYQ